MRKNIFYWIGAAMMLVVGLSSCSKTDDEEKANIITGLYGFSANDETADKRQILLNFISKNADFVNEIAFELLPKSKKIL